MAELILYRADDSEMVVPHKWAICGACRGEGKSSAYLGAYSREEFMEQGEEFMEDYLSGQYDRRCDACEGLGRVKHADVAKLSKADRAAWEAQCRDDAEYRAIERMERMAGA